uniref:1-acyl-sn-glycerol-3-phosphate acyltransferase n=1 Tax=uncultured myxobacterium HF0200_08J13 TaxID=723558 RepID=E7C3N6_9BACT|nr:1-acyl-sn-glycerol-3-phosphate acyltransferase [uncultured myxobacterium HF0200_08J13]
MFFLLIVRPIVLGLNVRRNQLLPTEGPAVVVANHNSHLDALTLMTLFGMRRLAIVRPVAVADYFLKNRLLAWFSTQIIGIIPLSRKMSGVHSDPLAGITAGLEAGQILILFPEGSRGEPKELNEFKTGIAHVAKRHPTVPIVPVFLELLSEVVFTRS